MKILLIEDNLELGQDIQNFLQQENHICEWVTTLGESKSKLEDFSYDVILLDLMLPDGSGLELLDAYRNEEDGQTGILILSARNAIEDRVKGLDLGADDYLTKPFHFSELNSRLKAIYRRRHFNGSRKITYEGIEIDPQQQQVLVNDQPVVLTKKEFQLLVHFIANKNRILTKQSIAEHLWGDHVDYLDSHDFVYQHIKNLRKKLTQAGGREYLSNIYGIGYRLKSAAS